MPVPTDAGGIRCDFLQQAFESTGAKLLYLQPWFSNPTGSVLASERHAQVRLTAPIPGILNIVTYGQDEGVPAGNATAVLRAYLFSADAPDYVRREEPAWQAWLQGLSVPA